MKVATVGISLAIRNVHSGLSTGSSSVSVPASAGPTTRMPRAISQYGIAICVTPKNASTTNWAMVGDRSPMTNGTSTSPLKPRFHTVSQRDDSWRRTRRPMTTPAYAMPLPSAQPTATSCPSCQPLAMMRPMPHRPANRLIVLRRSAASPSQNTEARYIQNGAVYWRKIAFAAVPRAIAVMNIRFMAANDRPMRNIAGRNVISRRVRSGVSDRAANSVRQQAIDPGKSTPNIVPASSGGSWVPNGVGFVSILAKAPLRIQRTAAAKTQSRACAGDGADEWDGGGEVIVRLSTTVRCRVNSIVESRRSGYHREASPPRPIRGRACVSHSL